MLHVPTQCINLLSGYLTGRQQVVMVNGKSSAPSAVTSGVPQGSVLGPTMFIALMHDINDSVSSGTFLSLFADDILVFRPQTHDGDVAVFQADLDSISQWGNVNQLSFNPSKSAHIRLSRKRNPGQAEYFLDGARIPSVSSAKYLGLHIDQKFNWTTHWAVKCAAARKRMRYLNALFKYRNSAARIKLFEALVQPLFDYCPSVTWSFLFGTVRKIEHCSRKFLRSVRLGVSSR